MKKILSVVFGLLILISCNQAQNKKLIIPRGNPKAVAGESVATFAGGCFWHAEIVFQSLVGVRDAVSGYAGGTDTSPSYDKVSTGRTGHAESVQVYYDPSKISYETLVKAFFASIDPTTLNRQGNDEGTEYRSIAFYRTDKEKQIIVNEINQLNRTGKYNRKIVTEVVPFVKFYTAEAYHQEFIFNNPDQGYVRNVSIPDFLRFKQQFQGNFK